jgi:hypothetical protein
MILPPFEVLQTLRSRRSLPFYIKEACDMNSMAGCEIIDVAASFRAACWPIDVHPERVGMQRRKPHASLPIRRSQNDVAVVTVSSSRLRVRQV